MAKPKQNIVLKADNALAAISSGEKLSRGEVLELIISNMIEEAKESLNEKISKVDEAGSALNKASHVKMSPAEFASAFPDAHFMVRYSTYTHDNVVDVSAVAQGLPSLELAKAPCAEELNFYRKVCAEANSARDELDALQDRGLKTKLLKHMLSKSDAGSNLLEQINMISTSFKKYMKEGE